MLSDDGGDGSGFVCMHMIQLAHGTCFCVDVCVDLSVFASCMCMSTYKYTCLHNRKYKPTRVHLFTQTYFLCAGGLQCRFDVHGCCRRMAQQRARCQNTSPVSTLCSR